MNRTYNILKKLRDRILKAGLNFKFDSTKNVGDEYDDAVENLVYEETSEKYMNRASILKDIEDAMKKIKEKRYGKCELCGKKIDRKRLKTRPWARYCINCQKKIDSTGY